MRKNLTVGVLRKKQKGSKGRKKNVRLFVTMAYSRKGARKGKKEGKNFMLFLLNERSSGNFRNITVCQKQ